MEKYIATLKTILDEEDFVNGCNNLYNTMSYPLTKEQEKIYEELDEIRLEASQEAERKC